MQHHEHARPCARLLRRDVAGTDHERLARVLSTQPAQVPHRQVRAQNQNLPDTLSSVLIILQQRALFLRPGPRTLVVVASWRAPRRLTTRGGRLAGTRSKALSLAAWCATLPRGTREYGSATGAPYYYTCSVCACRPSLPTDTPFPSFVFTPRSTAPRDAATEKRT